MTTSNHIAVSVDDRRSRRAEVHLTAVVGAGLGPKIEAVALNVSAHGVMLETDAQLVPGRPVTIELTGLAQRPGRVAWTRDGYIGIAFSEPLALDEMLAIA